MVNQVAKSTRGKAPAPGAATWKPTLRHESKGYASKDAGYSTSTAPVRTAPGPQGPGRPVSRGGDSWHWRPKPPDKGGGSKASAQMDLKLAECLPLSSPEAHGPEEGACLEALLSWLNNDMAQLVRSPAAQEFRRSSLATVKGVVNDIHVTRCTEGELPSMRSPWGDRTRYVEVVAAWDVSNAAFSWRLENWHAEMQRADCPEVCLLICSTAVPSAAPVGSGDRNTGKEHLLICRFSSDHEAIEASGVNSDFPLGQFYVISCPASVRPLRFVSMVPTSGLPLWRVEHKQVLPLPS